MMVYSITDRKSFEKLREFADYIISKKTDSKTVLALVANKSDLVHMSCTTNLEATQFCAEYNCLFFETSASENYNSVTNAYMSICKQVKVNHKKREKISKFMQNPAIKAKLQIRNPIRGLEMKWRSRAPTMWQRVAIMHKEQFRGKEPCVPNVLNSLECFHIFMYTLTCWDVASTIVLIAHFSDWKYFFTTLFYAYM